ncbi:MAG: MG2 domain-containing protein, partial [Candidatus Eremiobacteraeota bacterium]|nr:MG2 domain-containing protein [Candidatus Eremiobacteraeota bacterium]
MKRSISTLTAMAALVLVFAWTARADQPDYIYGGPAGAFVPGRTVIADYWDENNGTSKAPLEVAVYRIPLARVIALGGFDRFQGDRKVLSVAGLELVTTVAGKRADSGGRWSVEISALPVGYYVAAASVGTGQVNSIFDVTTLGMVGNRVGSTRALFAVDLRTFERHIGPTHFDLHANGAVRSIEADPSGIATFTMKPGGKEPVVVASTADGSSIVQTIDSWYGSENVGDVGLVQTDRPIYRAGQTIDVRAIVRTGGIGAYDVPTGTRRVKVTSPDGTTIYDHDRPLSSFGTLAAEVRLPVAARLGFYSISVGALSASVNVLAYKKPEYEIAFKPDKAFVVGGDAATFTLAANYFFGRPAAGMNLHYVAYKQPRYWFFEGPFASLEADYFRRPFNYQRTKIAEGDFATDAAGKHIIELGTEKSEFEQDIQIEADGRDASGRTVQVTSILRVVPASFRISLTSDEWFAQVGKSMTMTATTRSYDDLAHPGVPLAIEIVGTRWDEKSQKSVEISREKRTVTTGPDGRTTFGWTPKSGGSYSFAATAPDERGNIARGFAYLWVLGDGEETWFAPMENPMVVAQKNTFAPGERPRVLITLLKPGRDVVVFVSTDRLISTRVVHVTATTLALNLDAPKDASQFTVTAQLPNENGVSSASATIKIAPPPKGLYVTITPGKAKYAPGERATFAIEARDSRGRPVRAELGIGIVDEALYAVQNATPLNPLETFYGRSAYFYPSYSWFRPNAGRMLVKAGTTSDTFSEYATPLNTIAHATSRSSAAAVIRNNFQDTAYWSPSVVTDANGRATISFVWPDNLTTWRADGLAVTRSTDVGTASAKALVTKDFLVRLETPRFLRAGDTSEITGIAQGMADRRDVTMKLDTGGMGLGTFDALLHLDANNSADISWPVKAPGVGDVLLTLSGSDGERSDAMRRPLPLLAGTAAEHVRGAGMLPQNDSLAVALPGGYVGGDVTVTLSPSIVAELVQNLRLLDVYPYYCTEQTMSAALPAIFIDRVLKRGNLTAPSDISTAQIVANAIARLGQLQHSDGSWGWWENDTGHPYMTAYALYGLAEFRKGGYVVADSMYDRGVASLIEQLQSTNSHTLRFWGGAQPGSEWNTRAFMLYALADASPAKAKGEAATWFAQTLAHAKQLNPYALAVLGLAEHQLGNDTAARSLLAALDTRAVNDGDYTFWRGDTWHYAWEDDPIETTAYALRLEAALAPNSPTVVRVVNFLRAERRGNWWYTTKDTAAAIYALAEATNPDASEFHPDETIRVLVDGKEVRALHVTTPILDAADAQILIPPASVRNGASITFERTGVGSLYWASDAVRYVPPSATSASDADRGLLSRLFAKAPEFSIDRKYDAGHPGPWRVGDEIKVTVTVQTREDVQYVLVEDPFPAGAEHQDEQGQAASQSWSGVQILDDHAAFFADRLYPGSPLTIRYTLRVTTPGTYTAPSPTANAMYGPPVSAVGQGTTITV